MSRHPLDQDPGLPRRTSFGNASVMTTYPLWAHPEVFEHAETWLEIRDCIKGEKAVKEKGEDYLRRLDEMTDLEYDAYLDRAVFFNMTGRTVSALTGIVFQREPKVQNLPTKVKKAFISPTRSGVSFGAFLKKACRELVSMGRYGVLVDMAPDGAGAPYFVGYTTEHILDWAVVTIEGRHVLSEVVLREVTEKPRAFGGRREHEILIRRLLLQFDTKRNRYVYVQHVYRGDSSHVDLTNATPEIIVPTRNGVPFDRIPFAFLGALDNTPDVDRSPIADIAHLNLSHYRSYAELEHSRFYVAMPVWFAQVPAGNTETSYRVGSAVVWECAPGERPGILEMNGHGLKGLLDACNQKEDQISALGGRLMSGQTRSVAESDNSLKLKEGNERSILLNIVFCLNEAMTELLRKWCWWAGADNVDDVSVELNSEFLTDSLGARELRAVYAMYTDGVVPVTVLHHYLQKAEVVPDWMDVDTFKDLLDDEEEFKNQPDVWASMKGYNTAKDRVDARLKRRELRVKEDLAEAATTKVEEEVRANRADERLRKQQIDKPAPAPAAPASNPPIPKK